MKIIFKFITIIILIVIIFLGYLSLVGIKTEKFNNQIENKIKKINSDLSIELKDIKIVLDIKNFKLNAKTINPKLKIKNKVIEIENVKTRISLKSFLEGKFSIENLEISTKSLKIDNAISFAKLLYNSPELYILNKFVKDGFLIADLKLEFNSDGELTKNYSVNGVVKDGKIDFSKKFNIKNFDFIFNFKNNNLVVRDIILLFNDYKLSSEKISIKKIKNEFFVQGKIDQKTFTLGKNEVELYFEPFFSDLDIEKLKLSSKNIFTFKFNNKLRFNDLKIDSSIKIDQLIFSNNSNLKKIFPNIKKNISLINNEVNVKYKKKNFKIEGSGDFLFQDNNDSITYQFEKKNNDLFFQTSLKIKNNPLILEFLNFQKDKDHETMINFKGIKNQSNEIRINSFSLIEKENKIEIENLILNDKNEIINFDNLNLDYFDKENVKNSIKIFKKNKEYIVKGSFFNASSLIKNLLDFNSKDSNFIKINKKFNIDIKRVRLDKDYDLENLVGFLLIKKHKIFKANLSGQFESKKKMNFTVNTNNGNKTTTLFLGHAEPIVRKYDFIKGFDEGELDFYSSSNGNESKSTLKIFNFKLKELPALTKILTLASLQGIADILSGEGIRFSEFEMNFKSNQDLITIDEIYAIGPAISILVEGYVEKNKLISLRGTLVPATTINKFIGSLPVLGNILVGSKTGEGVFGVSFKIKGPPKNLETTVNPIKTLTPRFITRTLEKIKKSN